MNLSSKWNLTGTSTAALVMLLGLGALPVSAGLITNGSFDGGTKSFAINDPTVLNGWTATPSGNKVLDCLVFNAGSSNMCGTTNGVSNTMALWHNPGASLDGGNYVMIDGDPGYSTPLTQQVSGLVVGHQYTLMFYDAAGQQNGFNSNTGPISVHWNVTFASDTKSSNTMTFAQGSATNSFAAWSQQAMVFTASATSQLLSFLAVGPSGAPPFLLLDGVTLTDTTSQATPEPAYMALIGLALICVPMSRRLKKKQ